MTTTPEPLTGVAAERALLGILLCSNEAFGRCSAFLEAEHFIDPVNAGIYREIQGTINAGGQMFAFDLIKAHARAGSLDEIGGKENIGRMVAEAGVILEAGRLARIIHDEAYHRQQLADAPDAAAVKAA